MATIFYKTGTGPFDGRDKSTYPPPPDSPPSRPVRQFVPQIRTFHEKEIGGGAVFLEDAVNTFAKEQHALTGQTPILKPFPGGCTVIYWIPAEQAPTGPVADTTKGWWPNRLAAPILKGDGRPNPIRDDTKFD